MIDKKEIFKSGSISSKELIELIEQKDQGKDDFVLVDVREDYEYLNQSIDGTDLLLPTSNFDELVKILEDIKDRSIILYCRTGTRTGQLLEILKKVGFKNIAHLSDGITQYLGKTSQSAPIPKKGKI